MIFLIHDDYLMKENQLCILKTLLRKKLIYDLHRGGLASHLGCQKSLKVVKEQYFCPKQGVECFVKRYHACHYLFLKTFSLASLACKEVDYIFICLWFVLKDGSLRSWQKTTNAYGVSWRECDFMEPIFNCFRL